MNKKIIYFIMYRDRLGKWAETKTSGCSILTSLITLGESRDIPAIVFPQY